MRLRFPKHHSTTKVFVFEDEPLVNPQQTNQQNQDPPPCPPPFLTYSYLHILTHALQRGRIALLEDASGFQTFKYGRMGEVIENNRTFVLPNERYPYSFKMKYTYDSWNRVQDITYPDGEVVHYKYNTGGMLDRVYGQAVVSNSIIIKGVTPGTTGPIVPSVPSKTYTYNYIDSTRYNEFELKSGQWYGNGTHSHYRYDILQRLDTLLLYNSIGQSLQNIKYTYDKVGNITRIQNLAGIYDSLGGRYNCRYIYDSLYRLTLATDSLYRGTMLVGRYGQYTDYFPDGRIQHKQDETWLLNSMFPFITNTYTYGNPDQPHTLTSISGWLRSSSTYTWDANGNMTKQGSIKLEWDEENRLKGVTKSAQGVCFAYDASGERFYKNSGPMTTLMVNGRRVRLPLYGGPVLYTSPYVVVTPNGYTKHYFVENERFASRIGDGNITGLNSHATTNAALAAKQLRVNKDAPDSIPPGQFYNFRTLPAHWSSHHTTYWQHPDHLGSASWVTDTNGRGYQHFQYRAWGEPFIEQNSTANGYETRYTFSGKERDEETGYSYFGARYYNSALSIWLSVDPLADKYPNKSSYSYCSNNPIKIIDPNGEDEWQLDKENGTFTRVGDKGGNTVDYYSVGEKDKDGIFQEESNYTINREGKCNINSFRIKESENATLSAFHIPDAVEGEISSGYFLERSGPDTEASGEKKRISAGTYGLTKNYAVNSKYPNNPRLYRESERTSDGYGAFAARGILIHAGNFYSNGVGCLLPGASKGTKKGDYVVWNSGDIVNKITKLCNSRGWDNMRINIINAF